MAITFPRPFPVVGKLFSDCDFNLQRFDAINHLDSGASQVLNTVDPRWHGDWTTAPVDRATAQIWKAWKDSLRGGSRHFLGYDAERPYPKNYPTGFAGLIIAGGSTPFTGLAVNVTALTTVSIALDSLPASFVFKAGDMVEIDQSTNKGLHTILEDVTANGSGVATLTVEPFVLTNVFDASATVNLVKPSCIMILDHDTWSAPRGIEAAPITFSAVQKLV